jgi:hypothetical protein
VFSDSTGEYGKLLLSYPMAEAYREACAAETFVQFASRIAEGRLSSYKDDVSKLLHDLGKEQFTDVGKLDRSTIARAIAYGVAKAWCLTEGMNPIDAYRRMLSQDIANAVEDVDLYELLSRVQDHYIAHSEVPVLSTCFFFIAEWPQELVRAFNSFKSMHEI